MDGILARNRERVDAHLRALGEALLGEAARAPGSAEGARLHALLCGLRDAIGEGWQLTTDLRARLAWSDQGQARARACLEGAADAVISVAAGGAIASWSAGAERIFATPAREALGQPIERWLPSVEALRARGGVWPIQGSRRGERVALEASAAPVLLGAEVLTVVVAREPAPASPPVVVRAEPVAAPVPSGPFGEARGEPLLPPSVLSATSDGMLVLDLAGVVVCVNRAFADLVGLDPEDLDGRPAAEVVHFLRELGPQPADAFDALLLAPPPGVEAPPRACTLSQPSPRTTRLSRSPLRTAAGALVGSVVVVRDVTHEDRVARAKEELVGNVSHELRTPLTSIRGFVDLLRAGRAGGVSARQKEMLDVVAENVERLTQLVADLLEVDRVEHVSITLVRVDLLALLRAVIQDELPHADRKRLTLALHAPPPGGPPPEAPLEVVGDPVRLRQVFTNLVNNAVKYTPDGRVTVRAAARDGRVTVDVEDTGVGIAPADQAQLFQRFFRADDPYVREAGGTGLGLSIVKTLVERQGGTISIESEPRIGTCVRIALPEAPPRAKGGKSSRSVRHLQRPAPSAPRSAEPRRLRALAIDLDPIRQALYGVALQKEGIDLTSASSLPQAQMLSAQSAVDLVLVGRQAPSMPAGDDDEDAQGELLSALRGDPTLGAAALVLVITRDELGRGLRGGADGFVFEPLDLEALRVEVRRVLEVRGAASRMPGSVT